MKILFFTYKILDFFHSLKTQFEKKSLFFLFWKNTFRIHRFFSAIPIFWEAAKSLFSDISQWSTVEPFVKWISFQIWTKDKRHLQSLYFRTSAQQLSQLFAKSKVWKKKYFFSKFNLKVWKMNSSWNFNAFRSKKFQNWLIFTL